MQQSRASGIWRWKHGGGLVGVQRKEDTRRRKRRKQTMSAEVWTFNSSGAPQFKAAMAHAWDQMGAPPIAICAQEHLATTGRLPDVRAAASGQAWNVVAAKAVITREGGASAGVAI